MRKLSVESSDKCPTHRSTVSSDQFPSQTYTSHSVFYFVFCFCSALYVVHSGLRLFKQIVSTNKNIVLLIAENVCV